MTIFGFNIMRNKTTNTKFQEIDKRFDKIDQRLTVLEHDMSDIKTDLKILLNIKKGVN